MFKVGKLYAWEPVNRGAPKRYTFYSGDRNNIYGPDLITLREGEYVCVLDCVIFSEKYGIFDIKLLSPNGMAGWTRIFEEVFQS